LRKSECLQLLVKYSKSVSIVAKNELFFTLALWWSAFSCSLKLLCLLYLVSCNHFCGRLYICKLVVEMSETFYLKCILNYRELYFLQRKSCCRILLHSIVGIRSFLQYCTYYLIIWSFRFSWNCDRSIAKEKNSFLSEIRWFKKTAYDYNTTIQRSTWSTKIQNISRKSYGAVTISFSRFTTWSSIFIHFICTSVHIRSF